MGLPCNVAHTGALTAAPATGYLNVGPSLSDLLNTSFSATYAGRKSAAPTIINATDGAPYVVNLETITKVRLIGLRVNSGTVVVKLTSAKGADQAFPCSSLLLLHLPFAGDEVTAIKLVASSADIEIVLAGDVS